MSTPLNDLTGRRFGMLLAVMRTKSINGRTRWRCQCDCGAEINTRADVLTGGVARSCGCTRDISVRKANTRHGYWKTRTYGVWINMVRRCVNPKVDCFKDYGARGIKVCDRWRKFENFLADMGPCPPGLSLDRYPNNNGNYEPSNCRWATAKQQTRNRRTNRHVILPSGERVTLAEAAERSGLSPATIRGRVIRGWPIDRVLAA